MRTRTVATLTAMALLAASCGGVTDDSESVDAGDLLGSAATFAETLDLSTPEAAVETLTGAFRRGDFLTVWLALRSPTRLAQIWNFGEYGYLVPTAAIPDIEPAALLPDGIGHGEHSEGLSWYLFDRVMNAAADTGYLIDLRGATTITGTGPVPAGLPTPASRIVDVTVDGIDGNVEFWVMELSDGRWLVDQVVTSGLAPSDFRLIWIAPENGAGGLDDPPGFPEGPRNFYEALDLSDPEAALATFSDAMNRGDYPTAFLVFDRIAQSEIERSLAVFRFERAAGVPESAAETMRTGMPGWKGWEPDASVWGGFTAAMGVAADAGLFVVDLAGEVTVTGSEPGPTATDGRPTTDLTATVAGTDGTVVFRMVRAPSGRWRLLQVIVPGGDPEQIPWSVPTG